MRPVLPAALLALAACEAAPPPDAADACGAAGYQSLVGAPLAAVTLPADLNDRVIRPGEAVTLDFRPDRLNLELDADGTIVRVYCG